MKIDESINARPILDKALGSLENRIRQIYTLAYKDGYKQGMSDGIDALKKQVLEQGAKMDGDKE